MKDELFGVQLLLLSNVPIATFDTYKSKHFPILAREIFISRYVLNFNVEPKIYLYI